MLSMYSYCCLCILIVAYVFLLLSMYSYCCLCILIVSPCIPIVVYVLFMYSYCCLCILIVVYVLLLLVYAFLSLSMYSYCSSMYSYRCLRIIIVVYVFLLLSMYSQTRQPWLSFFHTFSSVVRQMPGYNSPRWGTVRTHPELLCCSMYCLFCVVLCIIWCFSDRVS